MGRLTRGVVSGARVESFDALTQRVRRMAGGLDALGVRQGDCVSVLMRNDIAFLEASYAVMMLGAYAVPINWHFKGEEVAYVLKDSDSRALIGHTDLLAAVVRDLPDDVTLIAVPPPAEVMAAYHLSSVAPPPRAHDYEKWIAAQTPYDGPSRPAPQSMIYTSGTTGHPKGVKRSAPTPEQEKELDQVRATIYGLKPGIRTALPGPLYHSAPNSFGLRAGKVAEAVFLLPKFDPEELLALIAREKIDTMFMVPTMFIRLLKLPEEVRRKYDCSSIRHIIHAAAPCPADVKKAMIDWWGPVIYEFYGGTESGPVTFATSEDAIRKPGSVGRVSPGADIRILDDNDRMLGRNQIGEIFSRMPCYPEFIYNKLPDKRREIDRDGFITCGDVGYIDDDGYVFICDRKRDMVISGGVNIYPAEIEAVLHAAPGVHDCAVFGVPDAEMGEALMAVVEPFAGKSVDIAAIRAHLMAHLANYKAPRIIEVHEKLPREDSGKIFKRRLRDPYWAKAGRTI